MVAEGDRIRLVSTSDPYTRLKSGDEGTVIRVREVFGDVTVSVDWDSGSTLSLLEGEDRWEVIR
jgi:hypothetical protein